MNVYKTYIACRLDHTCMCTLQLVDCKNDYDVRQILWMVRHNGRSVTKTLRSLCWYYGGVLILLTYVAHI